MFHNIRSESLPPILNSAERLALFPPFDGYTVIEIDTYNIYSWNANTQTWIKQSTGGSGGVVSVNAQTGAITITGTAPVVSTTVGTNVNISMAASTDSVNGYLTSNDHQLITGALPKSGGTMTGNLFLNGNATSGTQAVTFSQFQGALSGLSWKQTVVNATTTTLPANTYANGASGVGATLTGNANGAFAAVDGITNSLNDRILVKNEASGLKNGIYTLTTVGTGGTPYVLTRSTDNNTAALMTSAVVTVTSGTANANSAWTQTATGITMGTTAITWVLSFNTLQTADGTTLKLTGNTYSLNLANPNTWTGLQQFNIAGTGGNGATDFGLKIDPTYNQTSTAKATDLLINRTETAVGTGVQKLIDLQVAGASQFSVNNKGFLFVGGNTINAPGDQISSWIYGNLNTFGAFWNDNTIAGGTSSSPQVLNIGYGAAGSVTTYLTVGNNSITMSAPLSSSSTISAAPISVAASGLSTPFSINPVYVLSGTASETDLLINRTEATLGSGAHNFIDAQVSNTSKFTIDHNGNITKIGTINGLTVSPSTGTLSISNGKTITNNNTLTFSGVDGSTINFGAGGTMQRTLGVSGTAVSTSATSETNLAVIAIPAGIWNANGFIRVSALYKFTGGTSTRNVAIRLSTVSGDVGGGGGTPFFQSLAIASSNFVTRMEFNIYNANSTSSQIGFASGTPGFGPASGTVVNSALNTNTTQTFINFNGFPTSASDSVSIVGYSVELINP